MADHLDAPGLQSPNMDPRIDITDIYAFQKPGNAEKSILILNVNPLAPTLANSFEPKAVYELKIDTNGDAIADIAFRISFSNFENGRQNATVKRAVETAARETNDGEVIISGAPCSFGKEAHITTSGDYRFFAGIRSDPFFFDLAAFLAGLKFHNPGTDFFIDKNVFSIVLEVPNKAALGNNPAIGVWARTLMPRGNGLAADDRMGRPAINTVFNHGNDKNVFNAIDPSQDRAQFEASFVSTLEALGGYSTAQATTLAEILLPDILTYNYSSSAGFLNGRRLQDDVIDAELALVTNGAITSDFVGPHTDYLSEFPYVGNPH